MHVGRDKNKIHTRTVQSSKGKGRRIEKDCTDQKIAACGCPIKKFRSPCEYSVEYTVKTSATVKNTCMGVHRKIPDATETFIKINFQTFLVQEKKVSTKHLHKEKDNKRKRER